MKKKGLYLESFDTKKKYQGKGIGAYLLKFFIEKSFISNNKKLIWLNSLYDEDQSTEEKIMPDSFYEKNGFKIVPTKKQNFTKRQPDNKKIVRMELTREDFLKKYFYFYFDLNKLHIFGPYISKN